MLTAAFIRAHQPVERVVSVAPLMERRPVGLARSHRGDARNRIGLDVGLGSVGVSHGPQLATGMPGHPRHAPFPILDRGEQPRPVIGEANRSRSGGRD